MRPALLVLLATTACLEQTSGLVDAGLVDKDADAAVVADAGTVDAGIAPCPTNLPNWTVSGPSGAPIRGFMRVFAVEPDGKPIPNVTVVVEASAGRFERRTDLSGCAYFEHFGLSGPVDVHLFASANRAYQSDFGIDTQILVRGLRDQTADMDDIVATVTGTVTGLERTGAVGPTEAAFAEVQPITNPLLWPYQPRQLRREAPQVLKNQVLLGGPGFVLVDFERKVEPQRTSGLYLVAGRVEFPGGTFPAGRIVMTHMGFAVDLDLVNGERRDDVTIDLSHPLTATLAVDLLEFGPPDSISVDVFVRRPNGGTAAVGQTLDEPDPSGRLVFKIPTLTGVLAEGHYLAKYFASTEDGTVSFFRAMEDLPLPNGWPVVRMPSPPSLPSNLRADGRTLTATVSGRPAVVGVVIGQQPRFRWIMRTYRSAPDFEVTIPQVPTGFVDPISADQSVRIEWVGLGPSVDLTSVDDQTYRDSQWAVAVHTATVSFGLRE